MNGTVLRRVFAGTVGVVAAAGVVALVQAAIPDRDGVIKACYVPTLGVLRVIDSAASCQRGETTIVVECDRSRRPAGPGRLQRAQLVRGPAGASGDSRAAGPQGLPGPAGTSGVSGLVRVQVDSPFDDVATKEVFAECPAGTRILGGGYTFFFGGPTVPLRTNLPSVEFDGWYVSGTNEDGAPWSVSAIAMCANSN